MVEKSDVMADIKSGCENNWKKEEKQIKVGKG